MTTVPGKPCHVVVYEEIVQLDVVVLPVVEEEILHEREERKPLVASKEVSAPVRSPGKPEGVILMCQLRLLGEEPCGEYILSDIAQDHDRGIKPQAAVSFQQRKAQDIAEMGQRDDLPLNLLIDIRRDVHIVPDIVPGDHDKRM